MDSVMVRGGQQDIKYSDSETEFSTSINRDNVVVHCNSGKHNHGSSKIKLINRVDYIWEFQYYQGQIIAAHMNGEVIAYGMKGKEGGMVRVTNLVTEHRTLIRNRMREVKDVAFAFSRQQIVLGYIDEEGSVWIYEIRDEPKEITCNLLLHIYHRTSIPSNSIPNYRIIWCPYLSCYDDDDAESSDDPEKMFVILNGSKAEVWNYGIINSKYGTGPVEPNEDYRGYVEINHTSDLIDASFSSDGTAIAVASDDGYVKFFQVYMIENEKQKCLHEWVPHEGKPLSSIIFVDNLLEYSSQCWKFTITGANYNSELKLWSCETWSCIQTIHFKPHPNSLVQNIFLKMRIDYTGQFLVLSDINNKALYVMKLKRDDKAKMISVAMISQFLLPTSFLSFHITEADIRKLRSSELNNSDDYCNEPNDEQDDEDEDDDEINGGMGVVMKMFVIHQKKLQECDILFQPDSIMVDTESTVENSNGIDKLPKLDDLQSSVTLLIQQQQQQQQQQLNLMTPEAFTNPEKTSRPSSVRNSLTNDVINKSTEQVDGENIENLIDFQQPEKDNFASGGSSPSREVQEILSLNNSTYSTQDYFDNLKVQDDEELPQKEYNHADQLLFQDNANSEIVWPKIPMVKENEIIKDENLRQELRLGGGDDLATINDSDWSKTHLQAINFRLTSLENAIRDQSCVLQKIQQDFKLFATTKTTTAAAAATIENQSKDDFVKELDLAMSKQQLQIAKMLENLINMQKNNEREQQDHIVANVSQIVMKTVGDKIQSVVASEMKNVVVPTIRNLVETLKLHLDMHNTQKHNSDIHLQEKISKLINSKALAESLCISVANVISPILEKSYREMISTTLVPSWEKVCSNMFHQINDAFTQGTKEYTVSVETYMDRQRRVQEKGKDLITQMQTISENLSSNTEKLSGVLTSEIHKQLCSTFKLMQDVLTHNIKDVVSEQVKLGFKNHASVIEDSVINAVRSRAVTPSPHCDSQVTMAHIDLLLSRESYDEAFQLALSAENLNCVVYVCEKVDVNTLFQEHTPQQNCILALIQQLSMELTKNTEVKLSYIRAALVAINPDYPQTRQFIPKVLKDLLRQLQSFMTTNPTSKFIYDAKLLKMAVESILDK